MGRAPCCDKANVKKGPWSPEEDEKLRSHIQEYGTGGNWITLPGKAGLKRCGKSCRLRWINYLRPNIKHGSFTEDEEKLIIELHGMLGSRWSAIAQKLDGRTDNDIKNYWNTRLKKKRHLLEKANAGAEPGDRFASYRPPPHANLQVIAGQFAVEAAQQTPYLPTAISYPGVLPDFIPDSDVYMEEMRMGSSSHFAPNISQDQYLDYSSGMIVPSSSMNIVSSDHDGNLIYSPLDGNQYSTFSEQSNMYGDHFGQHSSIISTAGSLAMVAEQGWEYEDGNTTVERSIPTRLSDMGVGVQDEILFAQDSLNFPVDEPLSSLLVHTRALLSHPANCR